jgi:hypothetical protein
VGLFGFTLRPRQIVRENLKIDNLIDKFQRINDQLERGSFTVENLLPYLARFYLTNATLTFKIGSNFVVSFITL